MSVIMYFEGFPVILDSLIGSPLLVKIEKPAQNLRRVVNGMGPKY